MRNFTHFLLGLLIISSFYEYKDCSANPVDPIEAHTIETLNQNSTALFKDEKETKEEEEARKSYKSNVTPSEQAAASLAAVPAGTVTTGVVQVYVAK